jgi:hypothetical protein
MAIRAKTIKKYFNRSALSYFLCGLFRTPGLEAAACRQMVVIVAASLQMAGACRRKPAP